MNLSNPHSLCKEYETMIVRFQTFTACAVLAAFFVATAAVSARANIPIATIPLDGTLAGTAFNSQTHRLFISDTGNNTVLVVDVLAQAVIKCIPVDPTPVAIAVDEAGNRAFVSCSVSGRLDIIDGTSNTVTGSVNVGAGMTTNGVAWNPTTS